MRGCLGQEQDNESKEEERAEEDYRVFSKPPVELGVSELSGRSAGRIFVRGKVITNKMKEILPNLPSGLLQCDMLYNSYDFQNTVKS